MSEDSWKSPGAIAAIIGAIVAIIGLYFTYQSTLNDKRKTDLEDINNAQKHSIEVESLQKKQDRIDKLENQLKEISNKIEECKNNIGRANLGASVALDCLSSNEKTQSEKRDCQSDLQYAKDLADSNTKLWKELEEQQNDINKQINELSK